MNLINLCSNLNKDEVVKIYRQRRGLADDEETRNAMFMSLFIEYFAQLIPINLLDVISIR